MRVGEAALRWGLWLSSMALLLGVLACAGLRPDGPREADATAPAGPPHEGAHRPDRRDYAAFGAAYPELLEPNYLPFMVHRVRGEEALGDDLVFCRWADEQMPIRVHVEPPDIPEALQNEFDAHPRKPDHYVDAVSDALATWEEALEGHVRFRRVESGRRSDLRVRILGERAPTPEASVLVLGSTGGLRGACAAHGWDPRSDRMRVEFQVADLVLYIADDFGLLNPEQVRRAAVHELGHALGMSGHSPLSTDCMYSVLGEDRRVEALSIQDVNSFLSLYRLPNGAHYGRDAVDARPPKPPPAPPSGAPQLAIAPHVDAQHGFQIHPPAGWRSAGTPHGYFAADGPFWDFDASLEIFVWPYPTIESFMERFGGEFFGGGWLRDRGWMAVQGRPALRLAIDQADGRSAHALVVELGDGRIMLLLGLCPTEYRAQWQPWFIAALGSLELWAP